jgi:outer membrane protein assembly factor BamB
MQRPNPPKQRLVTLDLTGIPEGEVLRPMENVLDAEKNLFNTWETPQSSWGGFNIESGIEVADRDGRKVLRFEPQGRWERSILARGHSVRDGVIRAEIKQTATGATPNDDRNDVSEALAGIVFRWETTRSYYQFGIEGQRRLVLYRRCDDEWHVLAEHAVLAEHTVFADLQDGFVTLEVELAGDGIRCSCSELGVNIFVTDTTTRFGKVGIRVHGGAEVASFSLEQTTEQTHRDARRLAGERALVEARGDGIPDAVLVRTFNIADLGGYAMFEDFIEPGRYDMLVQGDQLRALTGDGEVIWETDEAVRRCVISRESKGHERLIYGFTGVREEQFANNVNGSSQMNVVDDEMVILRGDTGEIVALEKLPDGMPGLQMFDWSPTTGALSGSEPTDIVLREWRRDRGCQGGGLRLWAYDHNLNLLWDHEQRDHDNKGAHYGHHHALAFYDIDGDGRDELLAGGYMYGPDGSILWKHDRADEMWQVEGARHYDAVSIGALAGNDEEDPTAFLVGGSAGVYVVDALTGETRANHRVGHAQGRCEGKLRDDLPGTEILVATRWGNYGILTLFSGRGERLWSIQPDYVGQGSVPVVWGSQGHKLLWTNTSSDSQAFWDGHGRLVKPLSALRETWGDRMRRDVGCVAGIRLGVDPTECIGMTVDSKLHVFGPDE